MVSLGDPVTYDVIITAVDVIITAYFLVSSPLYFLLLERNRANNEGVTIVSMNVMTRIRALRTN